ncbi:MAG: aspartate carbamoyltransferase catalytic subunit [Candidatus Eisenbacteria bacterium]|nr:aspartate carbamoyltransferase catalytic subunit [Candidatus Eisenbacteria bacterium]
MSFNRTHLLGLEDLTKEEILEVLDTARSFRPVLDRPIKRVPALQGVTACNAFFEPSTRTRLSFELAEKRLSADSINFATAGSSVSKGETLRDTMLNIQAMRVDIVVIRHSSSGAPHFLARNIDARVINAGDGYHEHPTQGLLDLFTMREAMGKLEGLRVTIVGDIAHSRVARSNLWGLRSVGAHVTLVGPTTLMPVEIERTGARVCNRIDEALEGAQVVNVLRLQLERMTSGFLPTLREYAQRWGVTRERLKRCATGVRVMHPGPMNRGVEISSDLADGPESVILDQVTNGVAVRMAVLYLVRGGTRDGRGGIVPPPQEGVPV